MYRLPVFEDFIRKSKNWKEVYEEENNKNKKTIIILVSDDRTKSEYGTASRIKEYCDNNDITCYKVITDYAFAIKSPKEEKDKLIIHDYNGEDESISLNTPDIICIVRGGILQNRTGEKLLEIIEDSEIECINNIKVIKEVSDKFSSHMKMKQNEIPTLKTAYVPMMESIDVALDFIDTEFPIIIKVNNGAAGIGVMKADKYEDYVSIAQSMINLDTDIIIQRFVPHNFDIRIIILDGKAIASTKRIKSEHDFRTNLHQGGTSKPYKATPHEIEIAEKVANLFDTKYCGVDLINDGKNTYVLEVNSSPGSESEFYDLENGEVIDGNKVVEKFINYIIS